ncbi:MAG: hypothetical protein ACRBF0_13380 [Calditrichia bacterium]
MTEKSEFKTLFIKSFQFLLIFILIELSLGFIAKEIFFSQKTGKYARLTHSIKTDRSELLIMGSSRANRHYVPDILEKELKMTCYNAGVQGQYLIFHTALQKMILKRHKPKHIILNIDEGWLYESEESYKRLADLQPYYSDFETELKPILTLDSKFNTYKLLFSSYQTNSTLAHSVKYFFLPQQDYKGYRPLFIKMKKPLPRKTKPINSQMIKEDIQKIDTTFVRMFEEFINNAKTNNVNLIFTISPHLKQANALKVNKSLDLMKSMAVEQGIPLIDFSDDKTFIEQYHLFYDPLHLNNDGATIFSKLLADTLKVKIELL